MDDKNTCLVGERLEAKFTKKATSQLKIEFRGPVVDLQLGYTLLSVYLAIICQIDKKLTTSPWHYLKFQSTPFKPLTAYFLTRTVNPVSESLDYVDNIRPHIVQICEFGLLRISNP